MQVKNLEDVVLQFTLGRGDVLLATSIIENGIDMPNVNSIVVMVSYNSCLSVFAFFVAPLPPLVLSFSNYFCVALG